MMRWSASWLELGAEDVEKRAFEAVRERTDERCRDSGRKESEEALRAEDGPAEACVLRAAWYHSDATQRRLAVTGLFDERSILSAFYGCISMRMGGPKCRDGRMRGRGRSQAKP